MTCAGCDVESGFPGMFRLATDADTGMAFFQSGLRCPNPECRRPDKWGESKPWSCVSKILNKMNLGKKQKQKLDYDGLVRCDDSSRVQSMFEVVRLTLFTTWAISMALDLMSSNKYMSRIPNLITATC